MNKFFIICFVLLIGFVSAYTIGQTINQNVFDNQDFLKHNLNMTITDTYQANDRIFVEYSYDTLRKEIDKKGIETDEWKIVRLTGRIPYWIGYYRECRLINDSTECKQKALTFVKTKAKAFRQKEREWLEEQKTKEISNELTIEDFNGLGIN
jgi:hypothetical protein